MDINKTKSIQINFSELLYFSENTSANYCTEWDYSTTENDDIKRHTDSVHKGIKLEKFEKTLNCKQCLSTVSYKNLQQHMRMVHGGETRLENKIKCDLCSYQARRDKLRTHVSVVHLGKLLVCSDCDHTFKSTRSLREHKRIVHEGWQPEMKSCDKCDFKTYQPCLLRDHDNVVHAGLLIKCYLCTKEYKSKTALNVHMKTYHEGKKPQHKPCNICLKLVDDRFMGQHLNTKHYGNLKCEQCNSGEVCSLHFKCNQCKFIAIKPSGLKFHKKIMHKLLKQE